jgi:ribosomal protein S13
MLDRSKQFASQVEARLNQVHIEKDQRIRKLEEQVEELEGTIEQKHEINCQLTDQEESLINKISDLEKWISKLTARNPETA